MRRFALATALLVTFTAGALLGRAQLAPPTAQAAVALTFTNPTGYASANWDSICIFNKDAGGQYRGVMTFAPADPGGTRLPALQTQRGVATLPANYQSFVDSWIGFARADFPAYN